MPFLSVTRKWNATWACRRCLVHIWNIAPGALDQILDRYSDEACPATPAVRQATTDIPEDWCNYDMTAHLSPASRASGTSTGTLAPPGNDQSAQPPAAHEQRGSADGATTPYVFPNQPPPPAPQLPTYSTHQLAGEESRAPVRALVRYLIDWSHTSYTRWEAYVQRLGKDIVGDVTDETGWPF